MSDLRKLKNNKNLENDGNDDDVIYYCFCFSSVLLQKATVVINIYLFSKLYAKYKSFLKTYHITIVSRMRNFFECNKFHKKRTIIMSLIVKFKKIK